MREFRAQAIQLASAVVVMGTVLAMQWWATTGEAEHRVFLKRRLGLWQCSQGRWHLNDWPSRCLCRWPCVERGERTATADMAEMSRIKRFLSGGAAGASGAEK